MKILKHIVVSIVEHILLSIILLFFVMDDIYAMYQHRINRRKKNMQPIKSLNIFMRIVDRMLVGPSVRK